MIIIIFVLALLFFYLSWRRPLWVVYLIGAALPVYLIRLPIGPLPLTALELMILLLFVAMLLHRQIAWRAIYRQPLFWPLVAVLATSILAVVVSPEKVAALGLWRAYFVEPMLFLVCLLSLIKNRRQLAGIFWALGVSVLYLSIFCFWQKLTAWGVPAPYLLKDGSVDRVVGPYGYPNALGLYLGPIVILFSAWLLLTYKNFRELISDKYNWLKLAVVVFGLVTIVLAQSEAAVLAVGVVWLGLLFYFKKTRYLALILLILLAIMLVVSGPLRAFVVEKLLLQDWSGMVRRQIWAESWQMMRDHWFWGIGLAGYQQAIVPYHSSGNWMEIFLYPHNILLNFWSELGLLGLLAFAWLIIKSFWLNFKGLWQKSAAAKWLSVALLAVMTEIIIHGLVDVPFFKNDLAVLFLMFVGLAVINLHLKDKIIVSACLAGKKCSWDEEAKPNQKVIDMMIADEAIAVCPEQLGGLPTPRDPSEIVGERVVNNQGKDVTDKFYRGAEKALAIALENNCSQAILKAKSPACGCGQIYDGTFSRRLIEGDGIFTRLLKKKGIKVRTEKDER